MPQQNTLASQMKHRDREMVPRVLVQAMFALMFISLGLVGYATYTDRPLTGVAPNSPIAKEMQITLQGNRSDGVHVVGPTGKSLAYSADKRKGFIDVIWNSVMRERTVQNADPAAPLRLVRRENGTTAILDDATGWKIELIGYGKDNIAAFATLLD